MKRQLIIQQVSLDLNDQLSNYEYTHWTASQLDSYLSEALLTLCYDLPELFYENMIVTLDPNKVWQEPCSECSEIIKVYGEVDANGNVTKVFYQKKDSDIFEGADFGYSVCSNPNNASDVFAYSINTIDNKSFRIYGNLNPLETNRRVMIQCFKEVDPNLDDIPVRLVAAIKQWMLYRAMVIDAENNSTIAQIGAKHLETYTYLVQQLVSSHKRLESKRYEYNRVRQDQNSSAEQVPTRT